MTHFFPFRFAFKRLNPVDCDNLGAGFKVWICSDHFMDHLQL